MLLLDERPGIQVLGGGVPLLHIGNRHLLRETGVDHTLGLQLLKVLCLGRIEKVELLDLRVGAVGHVELLGLQTLLG